MKTDISSPRLMPVYWQSVVCSCLLLTQLLVCDGSMEVRPWYTGPTPTLTPQSCPVPDTNKPPTITPTQEKGTDGTYTSLLEMNPPLYLSNYRNPCWYECLEFRNPYPGGHYSFPGELDFSKTFDYFVSKVLYPRYKSGEGWRLRCLPNFYLLGAPKSGTSDLYYYITAHPDVLGPPAKEPQWWGFARTIKRPGRQNYSEIESFSSYVDIFDLAAESIRQHYDSSTGWHTKIIGDGSVGTLFHNDVWRRYEEDEESATEPKVLNQHFMHHVQPDAKFLVILRNPVDRLYSGFYFYYQNTDKFTPEAFHAHAVQGIELMNECLEQMSLRYCTYDLDLYKRMSRFRLRVGFDDVFLKDWFKVYDRKQFLVMTFEEYIADRYNIVSNVYEFLGVDPVSEEWFDEQSDLHDVVNHRKAEFQKAGPMLAKTRKLLDDFYEPRKQELAKLLNSDKYLWR